MTKIRYKKEARTNIAARIKPGTRITQQTKCFDEYNKALCNFMHKQLDLAPNTPGVIEPHEVAECIEQIINTEKPHLRYQLGTFAQKITQERFKDPTGNSYIQAKTEQFAQLRFVIRDDQS